MATASRSPIWVMGRRLVVGATALGSAWLTWAIGITEDPVWNPFYLVGLALAIFFFAAPAYRGRLPMKMLLSFHLTCWAIVVFDVVLRPALRSRLHYRAHEMFAESRPDYPRLPRYSPGGRFHGQEFGDLGATAGHVGVREPRDVDFVIDRFGYRNEPGAADRVVDTLAIGDSFGVGVGVTQSATWWSLLERDYGRSAYNLSYPGSPWRGLMRLTIEEDRLQVAEGAVVIWMFFTGNDLDEAYGEEVTGLLLSRTSSREAFRIRWETFRNRSPIHRMARNIMEAEDRSHLGGRVMFRSFPVGEPLLFHKDYIAATRRSLPEIREHPHYPLMVRTFRAAGDLGRARGWRMCLVVAPAKSEVYDFVVESRPAWSRPFKRSSLSKELEAIAGASGLAFLDLTPGFVEEARRLFEQDGKLLWWRDDTHWNEHGNALAARLIAEHCLESRRASTKEVRPVVVEPPGD